jgi:hypothetical protein
LENGVFPFSPEFTIRIHMSSPKIHYATNLDLRLGPVKSNMGLFGSRGLTAVVESSIIGTVHE